MPKDNPFSDNPFNKSDVSQLLLILAVVSVSCTFDHSADTLLGLP